MKAISFGRRFFHLLSIKTLIYRLLIFIFENVTNKPSLNLSLNS